MTTSPAEPVPAEPVPAEEAEPAKPAKAAARKGRAKRAAIEKATATAEPVSRTTDIVAGPGGVMTDEVGVVTGDLTIRTEAADGKVTVHVQYKDADEWYVVTGGRAPLTDPAAADAVHAIVTGILNRPEG